MTWTRTRLKYLCVDSGQYGLNISADQYVGQGTRLIRTTDISSGSLKQAADGVYVDSHVEERHRLRQGDLLLSRSGTPPGQSYSVQASESEATYAGYLVRFRPSPDVDARFLAYVARSSVFQQTILAESVSSTIQNFNAERYANITIVTPSPVERRRIADFLDFETARIDRLDALQRKAVARLEERDSALLDAMIDGLAASSGAVPFRRYIDGMDQGSSPQCDATPAGPDEWGVLKVSCLRPGSFYPDENKRLPEDVIPDVRREVKEGDLLITRANTPQLVGSTAVVPSTRRKLLLSDKIFRVRVSATMDPQYISLVARGSRIRALCGVVSNGASQSMANVRFEEIKDWPIPSASLTAQRRAIAMIDDETRRTQALRIKIDKQLALLAERRQALITAAVTGKIDVSTASGRGIED
ncbi:hypothetical protein Adu01nite_50870 [Paractinoplanes durhamensis]|uniref:Uncharacterized protein n=1 Tax=Paractinoplanes durhamensis TaxID=113563 RepID=A0ABQ3Z1N4_9ACTN|nr:hypothetical protein Adu01nite_50870 [Actinoplanes durhamensis]